MQSYLKIILNLIFITTGANSLSLANPNEKAEKLTAFCSINNGLNIRANVMKRITYLPGEIINGLIFLNEVEPFVRKNGVKDRKALFQCECGNKFETFIDSVKRGFKKSCGCLHKKVSSEKLMTHGFSQLPIYKVWKNMKRRCYNPKHKSFKDYGGRGIKVCETWLNDPESFVKWSFENGYKEGLQIDRINNNGNYQPDNCRFVSVAVNSRNRRSTKIDLNDIKEINSLKKRNPKLTAVKIAEKYKVHPKTITKILRTKSLV